MRYLSVCLVVVLAGCVQPRDKAWREDVTLGDADANVFDEGEGEAPTEVPETVTDDRDGDGFARADGDCNDAEARINPMAVEVPANVRDDDCDGRTDEEEEGCECGTDPSLPEGLDLCDGRFLIGWESLCYAPECGSGMGTLTRFGDPTNELAPRFGCAYTLLSTGPVDISLCDPASCPGGRRQDGTDFYGCGFDSWEPDPSPAGPDGTVICDTQQLILRLRAPSNALGFSFDFVYLSAEYPEFVGQGFNDTFYAIIERPAVGERRNIAFDEFGHEIEVDTTFFENPPETDISGTGYDLICMDHESYRTQCGSSTGWLRTSWNVGPGEEFSLIFSIHDEGDAIFDSTVILDNFRWSTAPVDPGTILL